MTLVILGKFYRTGMMGVRSRSRSVPEGTSAAASSSLFDDGGVIAKRDLGIAVWDDRNAIAQALTCQFAFRDDGSAIAFAERPGGNQRCCKQFAVWDNGSAIAKRSAGIAS